MMKDVNEFALKPGLIICLALRARRYDGEEGE